MQRFQMTFNARLFPVLTLATSLLVQPALAQDTQEWGMVGDWLIGIDPSLGNACYALNSYEDGTVLRTGLDFSGDENVWYILLGNDRWQSLEVDGEYEITMQFDREPAWTAVAAGVDMGGEAAFLYIFGSDANFFDEFILKHGVSFTYDGAEIASLSLAGSARALVGMVQCQEELDGQRDPFAKKKSKGVDPFAR